MRSRSPGPDTGFTLLEVLITLIILAVGMLGLANLQSKIHVTEIESYQRAHAVLLLQDMTDRLNSNRSAAADYASDDDTLGTDFEAVDCSAITSPTEKLACTDRNEWSNALQGASELKGTANAGGMISARGCIQQVTAPDDTVGVCQAGVYRITVVWQGLYTTAPPADGLTCGKDLYGIDGQRRAISTQISIGLPTCASPPE